jgi:hypothetical protein
MGAPSHGRNALIYVSGIEIVGANTWSLARSTSVVATPQVGEAYVRKVAGQYEWSGSINAWDQGDANPLADAAVAQTAVALLIYPYRTTAANYYSGSAIFSFTSDGGTSAGVSENVTFDGTGALTITGWA